MKKIPTLFERDWEGDRSRVLDKVTPGCEWVIAGEGVATRKYDGTACLVRNGYLWKRHEVRAGKQPPVAFILETRDEETGKTVGWVPVTDGPEDRWHREAFDDPDSQPLEDGTYELVGPKVQGNREHFDSHKLIRHSRATRIYGIDVQVPTFDGLREMLSLNDIEGVVWHHPDGRMAKIKARDFGIARGSNAYVNR